MVYGAVLGKGQDWYTDLNIVFQAVNNAQKGYNWLITDWECNQPVDELRGGYSWMTGGQLTGMVHRYRNLQWIWGVISGFDKDISKEEVLKHPLPVCDFDGFWKNPVTMQHPLAEIEIVPWDSSFVLFLSRNQKLAEEFREKLPFSKELVWYNERDVSESY